MNLVYTTIFAGQGESLLAGIDLPAPGFSLLDTNIGEGKKAMHEMVKRGNG